jgi:NAD(P) transhydrogenase subunit alpha
MKPGSVIVDLAVETGGNCELVEAGKVVTKHGVKIVGHLNVAGRLAADASMLYANNVFNFVSLLYDKESQALAIDWEDEIVTGTLVTRDGAIVHPALAPKPEPEPEPETEAEPEPEPETKSTETGPEEAGNDD